MSELSRRFRYWLNYENRYPYKRCWLRRKAADALISYAAWRSSHARWCWALAACWAMGLENDLLQSVDPNCNWCGKCQP